MAGSSQARAGELLQGVLRILRTHPNGLPAEEVLARLVARVPPTDFEAADDPDRPGVRRYERLVRLHMMQPMKAGWLVGRDGRWAITREGARALEQYPDPAALWTKVGSLCRERVEEPAPPDDEADDGWFSTALLSRMFAPSGTTEWSQVQAHLMSMSPNEFQRLLAGYMRGRGLEVAWDLPLDPDPWDDVNPYSDPFGIHRLC